MYPLGRASSVSCGPSRAAKGVGITVPVSVFRRKRLLQSSRRLRQASFADAPVCNRGLAEASPAFQAGEKSRVIYPPQASER